MVGWNPEWRKWKYIDGSTFFFAAACAAGQRLDWASGSDHSLLCCFTLTLNGNALARRMKKDSCSPALIWNPLPEIRLQYRRMSVTHSRSLPCRQCCDNDPFHRWNHSPFANCTSHLDGGFGNKSSATGVLPPSNALEYPKFAFLARGQDGRREPFQTPDESREQKMETQRARPREVGREQGEFKIQVYL